jgi:DNA-directed RNA polymerase subunit RPC12/RpoP/membrane protein implicated in regulation of membrane protease activity
MRGGGRIVGLLMMVGAAVLLLGFLAWGIAALTAAETSVTGLALGLFLALVIIAPLFGIGFYLFRRGVQEEKEFAQVAKEKKILNMVLTQGQVTIQELVIELEEPRANVEGMIRHVVGKQLFSGAINWDRGVLYSVESQQLTEGRKCPNCGGELQFAGKGVIVCPYCGSEVFLTQRAAASTVQAA